MKPLSGQVPMRTTASFLRTMAIIGVVAPLPVSVLAQEYAEGNWDHFSVNYRMGFNIQAKFSSSVAAPAAPSAGGAVNRAYSDGYVNVDSSGNAGGQTWNWAYQNASQISGGNLLFHASSFASSGSSMSDDPQHGIQLSYVHDWDHEDWGRWGLKVAFGYTDLCISDTSTLSGSLITDAYALNGVTPPLAPYTGSFSGPGTVIGSTPTRTSIAALISGNRNLDANLYDFHFGPTFDVDLSKRFSVEFGGGVAVGILDSTFTYNETTTSGGGTTFASGRTDDTSLQGGFYLEGGLACKVSDSVSVYAGAEYEYLDTANQTVAGQTAQIDLTGSVFFTLGLEFHF